MAGNAIDWQFKFLSQGEIWYVNGFHFPVPYEQTINLDDAHSYLVDCAEASLAFLCDSTTLVSVTSTLRGTPNAGRQKVSYINSPGLVTGQQELPVWVTASFKKWPDDASIDPVGRPFFRPGRFSFSGIPETAQQNGSPSVIWAATTVPFATQIRDTILPDFTPLQLTLVRDADPEHLPEPILGAICLVDSVELGRIGSQLTRKT